MQSTNQSGIIATVMTRSITFSEFLDTIGLQKFTGSLVDFAIRDYQRYISPHKGFSCAHRKLYGEASCSGYFRESVANEGLSKSLQLFPDRLAECKEAYLILQSQKFGSKKKDSEKNKEQKVGEAKANKTEQSGSNCCTDAIDPAKCCDTNSGGSGSTVNHSNCCDTNSDGIFSAADCTGCDFGGCDFGSCCS
jgi:putative component of membrane protein insertase Oxa1/YidC/SpoIIIJ protein YidD